MLNEKVIVYTQPFRRMKDKWKHFISRKIITNEYMNYKRFH